jgi:hypothetical protein
MALGAHKIMPVNITLLKNLRTIGYIWAIVGLLIVAISSVILLMDHTGTYWFLPIDPGNYALTAVLLLFPAVILIVVQWLISRQK